MSRVAFLGTGLIGGAMAEGAAKRGHAVTAWNRTPSKAEALAVHGVVPADTPIHAIEGAERIHLALPDDDALEAVLDACGGSLRGPIVVDHTTASPPRTRIRAEALAARSVRYLHAPVFMSPQMCREAKGSMFVSGPEAVFEAARDGLTEMTGTLRYLGPRPDKAAVFKLCGNAALISLIGGFADVLAMAAEAEIAPAEIHTLFDTFTPAASLAYRGKAMTEGRYTPASFELSMARKDIRLMLEAAGPRPLAVLPALADRMDQLLDRGHASDDMGILAIDSVPRRS